MDEATPNRAMPRATPGSGPGRTTLEADRPGEVEAIMRHLRSLSIMVSEGEASAAWVRWSGAFGSAWLPYADHRDEVVQAVLLDCGPDYYRFFPRETATSALRLLGAFSAYMVLETVVGLVALAASHAIAGPLPYLLAFMEAVATARVVMSLGRVSPAHGPDRVEVATCATYPMLASAGGLLCLTALARPGARALLDCAMVAQALMAFGLQRFALKARPDAVLRAPPQDAPSSEAS